METIARAVSAIGMCLIVCVAVSAQDAVTVPEPLEPWVPWVLHGQEYRQCPAISPGAGDRSGYACAWPSVLRVEAAADGGAFRQTWELLVAGWVALPGDTAYWPERLTVDGEPAAVVLHDGGPAVRLEPGVRRVEGQFSWSRRPDRLHVPAAVGVIDLVVDGSRISFPQRDGDALWLGDRPRDARAAASITMRVFRLLEDGSPVFLRTRLMLDVAGPAREVLLGPALPAGFVPTAMDSPLPARLETDASLRVQVRPGTWTVEISARASDPLAEGVLPQDVDNWPDREVWSYRPRPVLRVSQFEGGTPVDPAQAGVPPTWSQAAAYLLVPGDGYGIVERSRGRTEEERNRLRVYRELWLAFDGAEFLAQDRVQGTMARGWRLDMAEPYGLRYASEAGETLLVTEGSGDGATGVELRRRELDLVALSSVLNDGASLPIGGWAENLDDVAISVNLPPNHRLLGAAGADVARGAWSSEWSLLDIFLVLLVTVAAGRLLGWPAAILALATMTLTFLDARPIGWAVLNLLFAMALVRVAPEGRLRAWSLRYRLLSLVLAVVVTLPFVAQQTKLLIYPQLENPWSLPATVERIASMEELQRLKDTARLYEGPESATPSVELAQMKPAIPRDEALMAPLSSDSLERYAPGTVLQTGPGIPKWSWNRYRLEWNGPVTPDQTMDLIMLGPVANAAWRIGAVGTLIALLWWIAVSCFGWPTRRGSGRGVAATGAAVVIGVMFAPIAVPPVSAQMPDERLLGELQRRLTAPPECAPDCARASVARVSLAGDELEISLTAQSMIDIALPVPAAGDAWLPRMISIDDVAQPFLLRNADTSYLRVEPGSHELRLSGMLAPVDEFEIVFPLVPHRVVVEADGWEVIGLREGRLTAGTLKLQRRSETGETELKPVGFPSFVRIQRHVDLGVEWRVTSRVVRVAPQTGAIDLEIPLLDGETVLQEGLEVRSGVIAISLGATERAEAWNSRLEPVPALRLTAPTDVPWTESWRLRIGPQWRAEAVGIPPAALPPGGDWSLEFYPRPGESLELAVMRPSATEGPSLALDSIALRADVGARSGGYQLVIAYRSTRAGEQALQLPDKAVLESVRVDGETRPVHLENGRLLLPVAPGAHEAAVLWREDEDPGPVWRLPEVDLGSPASNLSVAASLPQNRWILWASGPDLGPAVLYWSELAVFILVALGLGAVSGIPLRRRDWLLLGVGLSTVSWGLMITFAIWVFVIAWRGRARPDWNRQYFNLLQLALAVFSVFVVFGLVTAIPAGLLATPDMHITGVGSYGNELRWFQDRVGGTVPDVSVFSLPLWVYKGVILAWALWLSFALIRWLPWAWRCWSEGGHWQGALVAGRGPGSAK